MSSHFYVITLQGNGQAATLKGIHEQPPGETREQAFDSILADSMQRTRITQPVILHFSLEPNQLGGAA